MLSESKTDTETKDMTLWENMKHKTLDDESPYRSHGRIQSEFWLEHKEMQGQIWIIGMHALLLKDVIFFSQEHSRFFI